MKLYRLKISSVAFDDNQAYTSAQLNGNDPYVAAISNPSAPDYDDISTIDNWHTLGSRIVNSAGGFCDYKFIRKEIKALYTATSAITAVATGTKTFTISGDQTVDIKHNDTIVVVSSTGNNGYYTVNGDSTLNGADTNIIVNEIISDATVDGSIEHSQFSTLAVGDQVTTSKYFIANEHERTTLLTMAQQVGLGELFNLYATGARETRASKAISEVRNRLTGTQAEQIALDIGSTTTLFIQYVQFGFEGQDEGDSQEGLFDYLESRSGTSYSSTGFSSYSYVPIGYADMTALAVDLMKILKDGLY